MTEAGLFPDGLLAGRPRGERYGVATLPPPPVYVAHRGEPLVAPQNTVAAFRSAAERGVPVIETDVVPTLDGTLVVTHDTELSLYYDVSGDIREMPLSDVLRARSRHAEFTDQHPPLLSDILSGPGRVVWHVEAKSGGAATLARIAEEIVRYGVQRQVAASCTISIGANAFEAVHAAYPMVYLIGISFDGANAPDLAAIAAAGVNAVALQHNADYLDAAFVAQAHALGLRVVAWTVNTRADRDRVVGYGVDEVYTDNYPWVAGLVEPLPLPFTDTFARSVIGTQWTARAGDRPLWQVLPSGAVSRGLFPGVVALVCVGAVLPPAPTSVRIQFTYTPRQLNEDNTRWAGLQVCMQNDIAVAHFGPITPTSGGSYGVLLRQNGTMQMDRYDPGENLRKIAEKLDTGAMVQDTPIPMEVEITADSITFRRLDNMSEVTANDVAYRGGHVALVSSSTGGEFSAFSMEAL